MYFPEPFPLGPAGPLKEERLTGIRAQTPVEIDVGEAHDLVFHLRIARVVIEVVDRLHQAGVSGSRHGYAKAGVGGHAAR